MRRRKAVPALRNENKEFDFWSTHDGTDFFSDTEEVGEGLQVRKRKPPKKRITMLLDPRLKLQLKRIAAEKGIPYQTLVQMWLREKVNAEIKAKLAS